MTINHGHGPKLLQLLHPRSRNNNNNTGGFDQSSPGNGSPNSRFNQNQHYFPQPSRPLNSYNSLSPKPPFTPPYQPRPNQTGNALTTSGQIQSPNRPTNIYNIGYPYYVPESWFQTQPEGSEKLEEGCDEIIERIMELYEKLPERVREKVSVELMRNSIKVNSDSSSASTTEQKGILNVGFSTTGTSRGLKAGMEEVESPGRLERFKIKTINLGGITTDDEDKNL